ncbi:MAG: peptidyl-alpha-hydroxyglycine alpha-amidating lyase family protein, partial [Thermoguttaceae bacterium]
MKIRINGMKGGTDLRTWMRTKLDAFSLFLITVLGGAAACGAGRYVKVDYPASTVPGEMILAVTYTLWIPDGVKTLRGVIVHQHGAGMTASKEGSTAAHDLHWQALAKKWDCALLGPSYHVLNDGDLGPAGSEFWFDPRRGSDKVFQKALQDLGMKSGHPELAAVPWALWGHSAGAGWADVMAMLHPDRVVAVYYRSGAALVWRGHPEYAQPTIPDAAIPIPRMCTVGVKEKGLTKILQTTYRQYRDHGGPAGFASDPRTGHECGDSRYFAIPFLDACLAMRLPNKGTNDQTLKPVDMGQCWLAPLGGDTAVPAAEFKGDLKESVWLPNAAVAKAWMEYVKTGAVGDTTPPPSPSSVKATNKGSQGTEITWDAEADFESGIRCFLVLRDGQELAQVPAKPAGKFGRALFQSMTYHDTPSQPLPEMRYLDTSSRPGEKHTYSVITVNGVGLKSSMSLPSYPRVNMSTWYEADPAWPQRPKNITWGPMSGVAVDRQDNVWVLSRSNPAVQVYRPDGKFLFSWGEGVIGTGHMLTLDHQGNVWVAEASRHVVLQLTPKGELLRTLGTPGEPGCDERHFNRPTDVAVTPEGEVFISDGYSNARVVHFDRSGKFVKAWGTLGTAPGELSLPHAIALDSRGRVYVADRNNARIQVFDQDGKSLDQWRNIIVPCAFWMTKDDELWVCGSSPMPWRPEDNVLGYPPK